MNRVRDLVRFYDLLDRLSERTGGPRLLAQCHGRLPWPERGVYFFFEVGENRSGSGGGPRVVRVGTHAISSGSTTSLWQRLSQHRGTANGQGGNHRGSIFRLLVGTAVQTKSNAAPVPSWGLKQDAGRAAQAIGLSAATIQQQEQSVERDVSAVIGAMPFLWLDVPDPPGPDSLRRVIERGAIALLSNWDGHALDPATPDWLGLMCDRERVRRSGLWNNNHVDEIYDSSFLDVFEDCLSKARSR